MQYTTKMLINTILQQKLEKERILSISYVNRQKLAAAVKFRDSDLIKLITGPRRAGKSVFAFLLLKDKDFAYLNFDDENLLGVRNYDEIICCLSEAYPGARTVLFDEIQNLPQWEIFVNKLQRRGYNLILTGSNANLLSSELATVLTGRYIDTEVLPFDFREFLSAKGCVAKAEDLAIPETKGKLSGYLDEYVKSGGFPEIVMKKLEARAYLETLFDAVLFKDVVKRHRIRFAQKIYDLLMFLIANFACEFSFTKLKNSLNFNSTNTVEKYIGYLQDAYLMFYLNRFSFKSSEQLRAPKKVYFADNGFISAKSFQFSENSGRLIENTVFTELLSRGYIPNRTLFYYKTRNKKEMDFLLRQSSAVSGLIQVCFNVGNHDIKNREVKALIEASGELKCERLLVITWDYQAEEEVKGVKVRFIPLLNWLLAPETITKP